MPSVTATDSSVRIILRLDEETFAEYERQAKTQAKEVEDLISQRLAQCLNYTASQGLYFNDAQRQEFGIIVGRSCATPEQALNACRNAFRVKCGTIQFQLSARHSQRLASRATIERRTSAEVAEREMMRGLEEHLGMR